MAVVFVAAGAGANNANGAALSVPVPAGIAANDFLLLNAYVQIGLTVNTPAGWTLLSAAAPSGDGFSNKYLFWKLAGAAEPAVTVTTAGAGTWLECVMEAWRGVKTAAPIDAAAAWGAASNTNTVVSPSVTTVANNALVVHAAASVTNTVWTPPAGTTRESVTPINNYFFISADTVVATPQAVSVSFTVAALNSHAQIASFSLAPLPTSGGSGKTAGAVGRTMRELKGHKPPVPPGRKPPPPVVNPPPSLPRRGGSDVEKLKGS